MILFLKNLTIKQNPKISINKFKTMPVNFFGVIKYIPQFNKNNENCLSQESFVHIK